MSIPTSIICRHKKTWFDTLSMDQLRDLCRAANLSHVKQTKLAMIALLCEYELSSSIASTTVTSLKDMCRSRSLMITGLKYQLVLRVLAHDTLQTSRGNDCRLSEERIFERVNGSIGTGFDACQWLADTVSEIRHGTQQQNGFDVRSKYPHVDDYQFALAAFRDAETAFSILINGCTLNAGTDCRESLSSALNHLQYLVVEARVFMSKSEKQAAIVWILELDNFFSEFMIDENTTKPLNELVRLLENDAYHITKGTLDPKKKVGIAPPRSPFRCLMNDGIKGPNKSINSAAAGVIKKPKAKVITSKTEIVYKKMARVLRKPGKDSNYVYGRLVHLLRSINSQCNYYEALGLYRSAFMALIVYFEKMDDPRLDSFHNFTIAIELLGEVLEEIVNVISLKEKKETIRWMTDLRTLTRPYRLGEIADMPLVDLISMVKDSMANEQETKRFFLPSLGH